MDTLVTLGSTVAQFVAIVGGLLSAAMVAWSGIQWMTATGDPQRMAQARNSLIGAVVGMVIVGVALIIPVIVSEIVVEPVGGIAVQVEAGYDCDNMMQDQLVLQRTASDPDGIQRLVAQIQVQVDACRSEMWSPVVRNSYAQETATDGAPDDCYQDPGSEDVTLGGMQVPRSLLSSAFVVPSNSRRDSRNNIVVYWTISPAEGVRGTPSDGAICWMYIGRLGVWSGAPASG